MKPVKSYEEFRKELHESKRIDEGFMDVVKDTLRKIGTFFKGLGSTFLNLLLLVALDVALHFTELFMMIRSKLFFGFNVEAALHKESVLLFHNLFS